jgi:anti-sigma regulatory factor (Ser/Thr protein kinase)
VDQALHTELTLPNQARALPLARAYLRELTVLAELPAECAAALVDAVEEACANVIDHAFEPGEVGTFTVASELTAGEVVVAVRDTGLPFDPEKVRANDASPSRVSGSGGLKQIRQAVDYAHWVHRGRQGKELRLVKRRANQHVTVASTAEELAPATFAQPIAPEQEYEVRRMQPEDALGICRCIYRVYGNTYMHEACYYPERMIHQNETGELASVVAVAADGEIVGHYALERPGLTRVAERGMAVVSPLHRGRDLMGRMRVAIEDEARRLGLVGVYSVAVTTHVYSQKVNEEFGSRVCGVYFGGGPRSMVFKKIHDGPLPQRVSWVIYHTYVQPPEREPVYAPARHRAVIERIYQELQAPAEFRDEIPGWEAEAESGRMDVSYHVQMDSGMIKVREIGQDTDAELRRATHDLFRVTGAEQISLELPLAHPGTPWLARQAEGVGFFFCGIGPGVADEGDALLLQCLAEPLDPARIQVANAFAKELVEYIAQDRERVSATAPAWGAA